MDWIIREEGFNSKPENIGDGKITLGSGLTNPKWHKLYRQRGNRWSAADNRAAVAEEVANRRRWAEKNIPNWDTLPTSSQKALLSYKYNYDFNQANSPKLFKALADSNLVEAARQIDATSKDPKFIKGLTDRRKREQQWFLSDVKERPMVLPTYPEPAVSTAVYNPYVQQSQNQPIPIKMVPDGYVEAHRLTPSEERRNNLLKSWETIQNFNRMMELTGIQNNPLREFVPLFNVGNIEADGGSIHIKPSHRGRLTELKKRTGKSEAELYRTGGPAVRKMITFARNARKWKHGEGGPLVRNLFYPGGEITYSKPFYSYDENGQKIDDTLNYNANIPEIIIISDSRKTPAQRNEDERFRQRSLRDYDEHNSNETTARQIRQSQKNWENSFEKQALDYAQAATTGIGIGADIVSGLPIYSSLKGASVLSRAETPLEYIEGGLWLTPMLGETYQGIKPIFKTASKPSNPTNLFVATQFSTETPEVTGRLSETQQAAEKGRNKLLEWIQSPFYKQRLEEEPFYKFSNDIVNEASTIVKEAPLDFSKTVREIDPLGHIAGTTKTRPALKVRDDGYRVFDLNTGLDVNIGSDLGSEAEDTTLHELLHYFTVNSKGIPESTSTMQIVDKGWMQPLEALYNPVGKNILRGKKWQNYILDQNDVLLPKYDSVVDMVMNRPDEAKAALLKAGRTEAQADVAIKSLQDRYVYWTDIQEQRANLQELFISKIKPHLKNPNDAAEIESFLSQHPEILENSAPYNYIQEVRPGSLKQYAGYFASALSTLPFINKLTTNEQ